MYGLSHWRNPLLLTSLISVVVSASAAENGPITILFLGDQGHHRPAERFLDLQPALASRGISLVFKADANALNSDKLYDYDGILVYANIEYITPKQEAALLAYVASGKGFIPVHCASYCFLNSPKYTELVGAQFKSHGVGVFRTTSVETDHPAIAGSGDFESWDETYTHHKHNEQQRTVLSYRVDESGRPEPWTWVRTHGKGRVFYTAWGHDHRTWRHPGFHNLVERGIRWAVGDDPRAVPALKDERSLPIPENSQVDATARPFDYVDAKIPFYPPSDEWGTMGKPIAKMQLPVLPEESMKHMVTPKGFRVQLFAAEPDIGKPMCMAWDERGRLWMAETVDYPNQLQPPGQGRDRIRICEDTDGDGRADRFIVFASKLSIPTSITFSQEGIIVHQAPETLFLRDTNGDDQADERRVLFRGWSTTDTHAGPSNMQYGLDNWIWGQQGYAGFNGDVGGRHHEFRQGFYRFKPDGSQLEFIRSTDNNTWGIGFSEEGLVFGSTANRNPSVFMPIPNRFYESVRGWSAERLASIADNHLFRPATNTVRQVDHHGGYTAGAGHALYTARTYPREYWNKTAFVCGPTGHLIGTFALYPAGSTFHSANRFNLLASHDEWTAPIMAEVGPDGNVWFIDWYNYIVQHNPTPAGFERGKGNAYITDLRDKKHGRIYRIVCESNSKQWTPLVDATPQKLVQTLKNDNLLWRRHAQRLLVERGKLDVLSDLLLLVADRSVDEIGLNVGAIHGLWTLHGLGALKDADSCATRATISALAHPSAGVRRNAVLVLPRKAELLPTLIDSQLLFDADPQVRLAATLAFAEMPKDSGAAQAIATAFANPAFMNDRWLADAATSAAARHDVHFLDLLLTGQDTVPLQRLRIIAEHYARGKPTDVAFLLTSLVQTSPRLAAAAVEGLSRGWQTDSVPKWQASLDEQLIALLARLPNGAKGHLVQLATQWGTNCLEPYADQIAQSLLAAASNESRSDANRLESARQLISLHPDDAGYLPTLIDLVSARLSPELADGLIRIVGSSAAAEAGQLICQRLVDWPPTAKRVAIQALLGRPQATKSLLESIRQRKISWNDLALDQKQALLSHPDNTIARLASGLIENTEYLPSADRQQVLRDLLPLTKINGDAVAGKLVYTKHCAKCHRYSGDGKTVGPDLTGVAVHTKNELLTQLIDPSRSVEGNYRVYSVVTNDGRIISGLLASETRTTIELIDTEANKHTVLRSDIEHLKPSDKSLMPEGFEKQLSQTELRDLLEFLTRRGRYLPLPLDKVATIVSTRGMFNNEDAGVERLIFPDWSPKTFAGVPFYLIDPQDNRVPNVVMLQSPNGKFPPLMPKMVRLDCHARVRALHLLSGISGWGAQRESSNGTTSMIVRFHFDNGRLEDHKLLDGQHFADYIGHFNVPKSQLAFKLRGQQVRYLSILPENDRIIDYIELIKGSDNTAPIVMAATLELK